MSLCQRRFFLSALLLAGIGATASPAWAQCSPSGTNATSTTCTQSTAITTAPPNGGPAVNGSPYPSTITVPANTLSGTVTKVVVKLNGISHTGAIGDLGFLLVSPSGYALSFMGFLGDFTPQSGINLTFDETPGNNAFACTNPPTTLTSGTYKSTVCGTNSNWVSFFSGFPSGTGWSGCTSSCPLAPQAGTATLTSVFTQETAPNGTWHLFTRDEGSLGGAGTITSWQLLITTSGMTSSATTTSISSVSPNPILRTPPGASDSAAINASVTSTAGTVNGGTVSFTDNGNALTCSGGNPTVSSNSATCTTTFAAEGVHNIAASYAGASGFANSSTTTNTFALVNDRSTLTGVTTTSGQFCNAGGITLPSAGTPLVYPSNVYVTSNGNLSGSSAFSGVIAGVTVTLNSFNISNGELPELLLVSPSGTPYMMMGDAYQTGSGTASSLVLADTGASFIPMSGSPSSGTFKPADYNAGTAQDPSFFANRNASALYDPSPAPTSGYNYPGGNGLGSATFGTTFGGGNPNGDWRLYAINSVDGDPGSIASWCLNFTVDAGAAATTTSLSPNPVQVFTTAPTQGTALTASVTSTSTVNTGTVTFTDSGTQLSCTNGSQPIPISSGTATCSVASFSSQGNHNITAAYSGGGSFGPSSTVAVVRVDARATKTVNSSTSYTYCNPGTITFPGLNNQAGTSSPYPANIIVPDLPGTINTTSVVFNSFKVNTGSAAHDFTSMLVGPSGGNSSTLDLMSRVGGTAENFTATVTLTDSASSSLPGTSFSSGSYKPTSLGGANTYPALAPPGPFAPPSGPFQYAATNGTSTLGSVFGSGGANTTTGDGTWSLFSQTVGNGTTGSIGTACLTFIVNPPVLTITSAHTGSYRQGSTGNIYTLHMTNNGPGPTGGTAATVVDSPSSGLTITAMSGTDWTCTLGTLTCTSTDVIAAATAYPDITVTFSVTNTATTPQTNAAMVSGGGSTGTANSNTDSTTIIPAPVLTITKSHTGNFIPGQTGVWNIAVADTAAVGGTTYGTTTVADTLPTGYTLASYSGSGWSCAGTGTANVSCTSTNVVDGNQSFPTLALTVNVPAASPNSVTNSASVSEGGILVASVSSNMDTVMLIRASLSISATHSSPIYQGGPGAITLTVNNAGATSAATETVSDAIDPAFTINSASSSSISGSCSISGQNVTCTIAAGTSFTSIAFTVYVTVSTTAGTPISNSTTLTDSSDTVTTGTANDSIAVSPQAPQVDSSLSQQVLSGSTDNGACAAGNRTLTATDLLKNTSASTLTNPYAAGITLTQGDTLLSQSASSASVAPGANLTFTFHIQLANCSTFRLGFDVDSN